MDAALLQQLSPGRRVRVAQPDEREERLREDRARDSEGCCDQHRRHRVLEDVAEDDPSLRDPEGARRHHVVRVAVPQELSANQSRDARPAHDADADHDHEDGARLEHGDDREQQEHAWDADHHLHDEQDEQVGLAAQEAGQAPQDDADRAIDRDRDDADRQRDARAVQDAREDVAAVVVGAEVALDDGGCRMFRHHQRVVLAAVVRVIEHRRFERPAVGGFKLVPVHLYRRRVLPRGERQHERDEEQHAKAKRVFVRMGRTWRGSMVGMRID